MAEIVVYTPDGKKQAVPLTGDRLTLGRSASADLSFPDDHELSRLHLAVERTGDGFLIRDLRSKNGTLVNGRSVKETLVLKARDKIAAGQLVAVFLPVPTPTPSVIFLDGDIAAETERATEVTSLGGVISDSGTSAGSQIGALIRAGDELASERPLAELFPVILKLAMDAVSAGRGVLMTMDDGELVERATRGESFKISAAVRDRVLASKLSVLVRDVLLDQSFRARDSIIAAHVQTLIAVPLQARDSVIGLIYVDSPTAHHEFTRDDLNLLTVMANVAATRVEHARLSELEQSRKLMERELQQAQAIQQMTLPARAPHVPGLDLAGHNAPARTVGGDHYDFFTDAHGNVALLVADVSGKGMPAALLAMALHARVQPLFEVPPVGPGALGDAMSRLNRLTTANCPPDKFITAFACVLNGATGKLTWCSAGHNPPLLVRADGSYELLKDGGVVMGIFDAVQYQQFEAQLNPTDLVVIYSDGVTEACSPSQDDFDIPVLAASVARHRNLPAQGIVEEVIADLKRWTGDAPPADDITLVIAKRVSNQ